MGAASIHETACKKLHKSVKDAYRALTEEAEYEYGHDSYNGTISTCELVGKIPKPEDEIAYDEALDKVDKRECVYYETSAEYVFIGWAAC